MRPQVISALSNAFAGVFGEMTLDTNAIAFVRLDERSNMMPYEIIYCSGIANIGRSVASMRARTLVEMRGI